MKLESLVNFKMKKRKLNSTNPKYWSKDKLVKPKIKKRRILSKKRKVEIYAVFEEND